MEEIKDFEFAPESCQYKVTDHCLQRYAERVKGLNGAGTDEDGKLTNEIKLLFLSSKSYYYGKIGKNNNPVGVYCNRNGWTFITDEKEKKMITLYKVDLNVDSDEVNQLYVNKALEKIAALTLSFEDQVLTEEAVREAYRRELSSNEALIDNLKQQIKNVEERNKSLRSMISTENYKSKAIHEELKSALEDFIIKDKSKLDDIAS